MADTIRKVDYFYAEIPNKPGEGAKALAALREAGVNLIALSAFPSGRKAQVDFIPEDTAAFKIAAKKAGLKLSARKTGFLLQGQDRIGAVSEMAEKLGKANINITACDALCAGEGRFAAIFWVKPPDIRKAAKVLGVGQQKSEPVAPPPQVQAQPESV